MSKTEERAADDRNYAEAIAKLGEAHMKRMLIVPAEHKQSSFGYLDGQPVAIDYGN